MTEAKHTPSPWLSKRPDHIRWDGPTGSFVILGGPDGTTLICHRPWSEGNPVGIQEHEANARLICAATDLLAACKGALNEIQRIGTEPGSLESQYQNAAVRYLSTAIAKAR